MNTLLPPARYTSFEQLKRRRDEERWALCNQSLSALLLLIYLLDIAIFFVQLTQLLTTQLVYEQTQVLVDVIGELIHIIEHLIPFTTWTGIYGTEHSKRANGSP